MKVSRMIARVAFGLASAASVAQAWPAWMPPLNSLVARASDNSQVGQNTAVASSSTADDTATSTANAFTISETGTSATGTNTGKATTTAKSSSKVTGSKSGNTTSHTSFSDAQAGSMTMINPTSAAYKPLYKAGNTITWEWNYTYVEATPTAVDVILSCSSITQTWTLTGNMSWQSPATFTWDSNVQATDAQKPLVPNNYTLIVKDSDAAITDTAEAGYLGVQSVFTFGLYTPAAYTNLSNWECTTCIVGAGTRISNELIIPMIVTSLFASAGFMWFLSGLDL